MRIALVSYEYPPDTALGGIATYVSQIGRSLAHAGSNVEVFCGSPTRTGSEQENGLRVHRVKTDRMAFPTAIVPLFLQRHRNQAFDVVEGPDFLAEARYICRALPDLPSVVKLHTPYFFARKFGRFPYSRERVRNFARLVWYAAKTRNFHALASRENPLFREERNHLLNADEIAAPSLAVSRVVAKTWGVTADRTSLVPYTYEPTPEMLAIPVETDTHRITFLGRLEWRKGVQDLARAVPLVLSRHPSARFRFVGAAGASPLAGINMKDYLAGQLSSYSDRIEFTGRVAPGDVPRFLADTDICVFPSRWESFGFVVLEAIAAGRAVVCTDNGGMAELVDHGKYGLLVPPKSPRDIAERVCQLLDDRSLRHALGHRGRHEALRRYAPESVIPKQLASYRRAIGRRQTALPMAS